MTKRIEGINKSALKSALMALFFGLLLLGFCLLFGCTPVRLEDYRMVEDMEKCTNLKFSYGKWTCLEGTGYKFEKIEESK